MSRFHVILLVGLFTLLGVACGGSTAAPDDLEEIDASDFSQPTQIDNRYAPMSPGTQWIFDGYTDEEGERLDHRLEFTVTDLTKEIEGITSVVAWIEDFSDGELVEAEIAFYAQADDGTVWFLGEYPEEYEDGEIIDSPAWIAGFEDAMAGIHMQASPQEGTPSYAQGWGPAVDWTDRGQVDEMGIETCVPLDCYQDVLVIAESNAEEPGAFQLKYYAPGVGNVRVGFRGDETKIEEMGLIELNQLDAAEMAAIRAKALELDARAYENAPDAYGETPPAQ
jgi:hypothetical protein